MNLSINKNIYQNIIKSNKSIKNKNMMLQFCCEKNNKIGFVLPKSLGSASRRNLFKRRCRAAFINNNNNNKFSVLVKPQTLDIQYDDISKIFCELCSNY